jgi:hypothetical protein
MNTSILAFQLLQATSVPKNRRKSAAVPSEPTKRPRRASQRNAAISIDLSGPLRQLMIEQCKDGENHITVYRGTRAELVAAGVPEAAFSAPNFEVETLNVCSTGSTAVLRGSICSADAGFELEIDWGTVKPYSQCSHPAIAELARMLLKEVSSWTRTDYERQIPYRATVDLVHPIDRLAADERAVDYKPRPGAPRVQLTPEFNEKLREYASCLYSWVLNDGEVVPCTAAAAQHRPRGSLRLVVDNDNCGDSQPAAAAPEVTHV